jgi:hypothetical protein
MSDSTRPGRIDRREAIRWMLAASATGWLVAGRLRGQPGAPAGYGLDPAMLKAVRPGELWPLTFTDNQRAAAAALCETIIPVDGHSPGASQVGVQDFIDEWISAPYPEQQRDRATILDGLGWLDAESRRRFGSDFAGLIMSQRHAILDDICYAPAAAPAFQGPARFFQRYRDLTAGGFFTSKEGMNDLQYVGNVPLDKFAGPPPELIRRLGLEPDLSA